MGGTVSSNKPAEKEFNNFYDIVDYIASYYILTMDFKSLSKLSEKEYCDKLVILTSDIIERYLTDTDVTFLAQRIKNGVEVNELKTEKVRYINKDSLESLDISNDFQKSIKKKRVCIGIAKFYVKIAHIFAAIIMTINPIYTFKDATGQTVKTTLLEKDKIPKNVNRKLYKLNICDNRIRALKKGEIVDNINGNVTIQPQVCSMNLNKDGTEKTLADEPGITELMRLYLDDKYDYSNGTFTGMSDQTARQFRRDLKLFYTAFTGNEDMPETIQKFSDIKLRDYSKKPGCQPPISSLNNRYTLSKKDELFVKYADNIKKMIQGAADNQYKLLDVINMLFTYVNDPYTGKRVIRVNPKLNDFTLQKAVEKTRKFIIDLYVKCETDYVNGVKIFEAIVESKIVETTQKQIDNLKYEASKIIQETKKASSPVLAPQPPKPPVIPNTYLYDDTDDTEDTSLTPIGNQNYAFRQNIMARNNVAARNDYRNNVDMSMNDVDMSMNDVDMSMNDVDMSMNDVDMSMNDVDMSMNDVDVPQNDVPQNNVPQNDVPQNNVPQNDVPQNNVPQNNVPQNNVPQNNMANQNI